MTAPAIPANADELAEALGNTGTRNQILHSEDTLREFIQSYADRQARSPNGETIERQVREQVEREFGQIFRANNLGDIPGLINRLNLDPRNPAAPPAVRNRHYNPAAPGAKLDEAKLFSGWADYMHTLWPGNRSAAAATKLSQLQEIQNSFGSSVPSDGGFLLAPEALRAELLRVALETALVRPRARVVPMNTLTVHYPMIDSTSNATSVYGGITGEWLEEGATPTDSTPTWGQLELRARNLVLYTEIPNNLYSDSLISLQAFMDQAYPEALAWFEDVAFIAGNGVGKPQGFLNGACAISVAKESGQLADTILWANLVNMFARMLPSSLARAVWVANLDTFPQLATMSQSVGTGGSLVWIGEGQGSGAPPVTILGRPVLWTEKVPTLGDAGDITFWDPGYYIVGDRETMMMDSSIHFKFSTFKTAVRLIERVDGQIWLKSAITPQTGSNTLSPIVKIAARA
jgi:HK97 family phage major capsid protein